jgi:hypothetical protein
MNDLYSCSAVIHDAGTQSTAARRQGQRFVVEPTRPSFHSLRVEQKRAQFVNVRRIKGEHEPEVGKWPTLMSATETKATDGFCFDSQ